MSSPTVPADGPVRRLTPTEKALIYTDLGAHHGLNEQGARELFSYRPLRECSEAVKILVLSEATYQGRLGILLNLNSIQSRLYHSRSRLNQRSYPTQEQEAALEIYQGMQRLEREHAGGELTSVYTAEEIGDIFETDDQNKIQIMLRAIDYIEHHVYIMLQNWNDPRVTAETGIPRQIRKRINGKEVTLYENETIREVLLNILTCNKNQAELLVDLADNGIWTNQNRALILSFADAMEKYVSDVHCTLEDAFTFARSGVGIDAPMSTNYCRSQYQYGRLRDTMNEVFGELPSLEDTGYRVGERNLKVYRQTNTAAQIEWLFPGDARSVDNVTDLVPKYIEETLVEFFRLQILNGTDCSTMEFPRSFYLGLALNHHGHWTGANIRITLTDQQMTNFSEYARALQHQVHHAPFQEGYNVHNLLDEMNNRDAIRALLGVDAQIHVSHMESIQGRATTKARTSCEDNFARVCLNAREHYPQLTATRTSCSLQTGLTCMEHTTWNLMLQPIIDRLPDLDSQKIRCMSDTVHAGARRQEARTILRSLIQYDVNPAVLLNEHTAVSTIDVPTMEAVEKVGPEATLHASPDATTFAESLPGSRARLEDASTPRRALSDPQDSITPPDLDAWRETWKAEIAAAAPPRSVTPSDSSKAKPVKNAAVSDVARAPIAPVKSADDVALRGASAKAVVASRVAPVAKAKNLAIPVVAPIVTRVKNAAVSDVARAPIAPVKSADRRLADVFQRAENVTEAYARSRAQAAQTRRRRIAPVGPIPVPAAPTPGPSVPATAPHIPHDDVISEFKKRLTEWRARHQSIRGSRARNVLWGMLTFLLMILTLGIVHKPFIHHLESNRLERYLDNDTSRNRSALTLVPQEQRHNAALMAPQYEKQTNRSLRQIETNVTNAIRSNDGPRLRGRF